MIHAEISSDDNFLTLRMMTDITLHTGVDVSDLIIDGNEDCILYLSTYRKLKPDISDYQFTLGETIYLTSENYLAVLTQILEP
jgi:hypothetical protein